MSWHIACRKGASLHHNKVPNTEGREQEFSQNWVAGEDRGGNDATEVEIGDMPGCAAGSPQAGLGR